MKTKTHKIRRLPLLLALILVCSGIISVFSNISSYAADNLNFGFLESVTPELQADSASYYTILSDCFENGIKINGRIDASSTTNPTPSDWFTRSVSVYLDGVEKKCSDLVSPALRLWGWVRKDDATRIDYSGFLVDAGCGYNTEGRYYGCNASGANRAKNVQEAIRDRAYGGEDESNITKLNGDISTIAVSPAADYIRSYKTFFNACSPAKIDVDSILATDPDSMIKDWLDENHYEENSKNKTVTVYTWLKTANIVDTENNGVFVSRSALSVSDAFTYTTPQGALEKGLIIYGASGKQYSARNSTCASLVEKINNGATNDTGTGYLDYYALHTDQDPIDLIKIQEEVEKTNTNNTKSCGITGIGWIVCPVLTFLADIADDAFKFLSDNFLSTSPNIFKGDTVFQAWSSIRSIANVAFVIVFLIIIFSQLTSFGIDNYGIKKLLPKLVIAAVMVNLSYYICQIAVDISNILGYSLESFFVGLTPGATSFAATKVGTATTVGFSGILESVMLVGATGVIVWSSLAAIIPAIAAAVVALVMILFILIGRQALIILLIIISPLAFVAFLLPNTEKLYEKWQKASVAMLMLFPIVATVFGASKLASNILTSVFSSTDNKMGQIAAAVVMVLPLFIVPGLLKKAMDGVGNIGTTLNSLGNKIGGAAGKRTGEAYGRSRLGQFQKYREGENSKRRALTASGAYTGKNPFSRLRSGINKGLNRVPGKFGAENATSGEKAVSQLEAEALRNAKAPLEKEIAQQKDPAKLDTFLESRAADRSRTAAERSAAMDTLAATGRDKVLRRLAAHPNVDQVALQKAIRSNAGVLSSKAPDLIKGAKNAFESVSGKDLVSFGAGTADTYIKHLSNLYTAAKAGGTGSQAEKDFILAGTSFNNAIQDIANDTTLQSSFSDETGLEIRSALSKIGDPALVANLHGANKIQANGKIR